MHSISTVSAIDAPTLLLQTDRVRRRIVASDNVAALVAALAYGEPRRGDVALLAGLTATRCAASFSEVAR